ncbi:DoxX family membrane protein [Halosegnis longus]|uniref:DoxX family protein n=1 Tax=Halosegnis longus TaxID=2216012 RepID=A0AAJ4UW81_9EURY|nr:MULTISPECIES: DoxX family membrane protein [Halobacteriales]RNJ26813.1 DoxX family protein [Salella cibi]
MSRAHRLADSVATLDRLPLARLALAVTITLAGVHKLVAPAPWDAMVVPSWADLLLPVSVRTWTLANAAGELLVGLLLFTDRYTAPLAAFVLLSLSGTLCYIALVAATGASVGVATELLVIIAIHDIGLAGLAARVTLDALTRDS